jgi:hypothetical protein
MNSARGSLRQRFFSDKTSVGRCAGLVTVDQRRSTAGVSPSSQVGAPAPLPESTPDQTSCHPGSANGTASMKHSSNGLALVSPRSQQPAAGTCRLPRKRVPASPSLSDLLCESLCTLSGMAEFVGIMDGAHDCKIALFNSLATNSTLCLELTQMSATNIRAAVRASNASFGIIEESL